MDIWSNFSYPFAAKNFSIPAAKKHVLILATEKFCNTAARELKLPFCH